MTEMSHSAVYAQVADISDHMLTAAREGNWAQLTRLELQCRSLVDMLRNVPSGAKAATADQAVHIERYLTNDQEIRTLVQHHLEALTATIGNIGVQQKLSRTYRAV